MLALVGAFAFIIVALLILALSYVRMLGSNSEQKTAIEAAALAAARECSRIVINTDEWGYVSLSDYAPTGTATVAADGFPQPVRSINTIIGTARLDLIIADKLGQPVMEDLAKQDLTKAISAKNQLVAALQAAILPGGSGQDKDGANVTPYASALAAYQQNQIRMTDGASYVNGSLQLSLGSLTGGALTRVPVPQPTSQSPVSPAQKVGDYYKAFTNIPYKGTGFVFGGIADSVRIVDSKLWVSTVPGLAYQVPTIIRAQAVENIKDIHASSAGYNMTAVACAEPATVHDPLPAPGALSISCPDGKVPEITKPMDLYTSGVMNGGGGSNPTTLLTAKVGDFPVDAGSSMAPMAWPLDGSVGPRNPSDVWRLGLYDWIRRAGTKANIASVINMQSTPLDNPTPGTFTWVGPVNFGGPYMALGTIPSGIIHIYKFASDGVVTYQSKPLTPLPLYASSHEQMHGEALKGINNSSVGVLSLTMPLGGVIKLDNDFDIYFRDEVRQPGDRLGGKHAGEPIAKPIVAMSKPKPGTLFAQNFTPAIRRGSQFPMVMGDGGPGGPAGPAGPYPPPPPPGPNKGFPPMVQARSDFGLIYNPAATVLTTMPGGSGPVRPFYETTGTAVDVRFRRTVDITGLPGATSDFGYIYEVAAP